MDFFNLKGFAYSQRHERRDFALYLDRILYSAWIEGMFEDFNCALDYDVRNNNIHYKSTSKRRFLLEDVLLEEIEEDILPDCWKEFLDKHKDDFIVKDSYDFKILEDSFDAFESQLGIDLLFIRLDKRRKGKLFLDNFLDELNII